MFSHLHTGQVQQGAQEGGRRGGEGGGHYPHEGGAKGEVKAADETFEAHIDMLL